MRKTRQRVRSSQVDVAEPEPDSNHSSATKVVQPLDSSFTPSPANQPSAPATDLGFRALRSGRQIGRKTDLRKVFRVSTLTAVDSSGKGDLASIAEADEPNAQAKAAEPRRKVARGVPIIDSSIEREPNRLHVEIKRSRQPTATPSPPNSPPRVAPNPCHDLASGASGHLQLRKSAEHLLMLASHAQQPANTWATQVGTPSRRHSPSSLWANDTLVDMAVADAGRTLGPAASFHASSSRYFTPGKFRLQLPGLSSAILATGPTTLSAETDCRSPLWSVSAH